MFVAASDPTLLGLAAIITALAGAATSIWGAVRAHKEGKEKADEELRAKLRECREEAEKLADEFHRIKMSRLEQ